MVITKTDTMSDEPRVENDKYRGNKQQNWLQLRMTTKAKVTRCDLFDRFFCIHVRLCEFHSNET